MFEFASDVYFVFYVQDNIVIIILLYVTLFPYANGIIMDSI